MCSLLFLAPTRHNTAHTQAADGLASLYVNLMTLFVTSDTVYIYIYIAADNTVIVNSELGREKVLVKCDVLSGHLPGGTEINYESSGSGW
jgi:hypothetical protein